MGRIAAVLLCLLVATGVATGQDLEPRTYSANPVGAAFLVAGFAHAAGTVIVADSSLPVSNVSATRDIPTLGGGYTFNLLGTVALVTAVVPYAWSDVGATIAGQPIAITRSGLADVRTKFSVNIIGNPAMGARAFARAPRRTIVGASLTVVAPTGAYEATQLVNVGTNRWSYKPEVGFSVPAGRWDIDGYAGVWFFAINDEFFPGAFARLQDPLVTLQGHVEYNIRPQFWIAGNGTWYVGGETRVEGRNAGDRMNNSRVGVTLSLPVARQQSVKVAYGVGASVRVGPNFHALSVAWQKVWLTTP